MQEADQRPVPGRSPYPSACDPAYTKQREGINGSYGLEALFYK
jgi:hypothetical protein